MKPEIKKTLQSILIAGVIGGGIFGGFEGCKWINKQYEKQARDPTRPFAYISKRFIGNEFVTFEKALRPQSYLTIRRKDGSAIVYESINNFGRELDLETVYIYDKNNNERKIDIYSEEGRVEIATKYRIDYNNYLAKIYEAKFGKINAKQSQ